MAAVAILDLFYVYLDDPQRVFVGLCHCAKFVGIGAVVSTTTLRQVNFNKNIGRKPKKRHKLHHHSSVNRANHRPSSSTKVQ